MIRKILHKIKNALSEQEQLKGSRILTAQSLEEFIHEIDTCISKGNLNIKELGGLETKLTKRKEEWNKLLFKGGAQEALIEDIDRHIKDNLQSIGNLKNKLSYIEK